MTTHQRAIVKRVVAFVVAVCVVFLTVDGLVNQNWYVAGFAVFAGVMLVDWLRPPAASPERVDPSTVPTDDVLAAVDATDGRILAIKLLRERHPGLGLKDAKELIDAHSR